MASDIALSIIEELFKLLCCFCEPISLDVQTIPRSAAAVLWLAALRPEVKPQGFWKNAQNEEKLENILKYLSIYTN